MKFLLQAYNNTDWLTDTDWVILELSEEQIDGIHKIQKVFNTYLPDDNCVAYLYNSDFTVHSEETITKYPELQTLISKKEDIMIIPEDFKTYFIPDSETINDVRLDAYIIKVGKGSIHCVCYGKYDGSIEVFTDDIIV